ncbi:MAG TPA: MarR family transcriptional regulator [Candidatus Saccharimonadales bacterium]|nr:MarR family transcriptional regulator [Candidatus Saccharimonadales bacterium]
MHHPTSRDQLIEQLLESITTLKRGMYGHLQAASGTLPISRAQLELLMAIRHLQPVSFKLLAAQLCLTPGAVSQLAEGLESLELIRRKATPADRRIQCLEITRKGNTLVQTAEKRRRKFMEQLMHDLTDDELALWLRLQQKLIAHVQTIQN